MEPDAGQITEQGPRNSERQREGPLPGIEVRKAASENPTPLIRWKLPSNLSSHRGKVKKNKLKGKKGRSDRKLLHRHEKGKPKSAKEAKLPLTRTFPSQKDQGTNCWDGRLRLCSKHYKAPTHRNSELARASWRRRGQTKLQWNECEL